MPSLAPLSTVHRGPAAKVLRAVGRYDLLKREQLERLLQVSPRHVKEPLLDLTREGYLEYRKLYINDTGSPPYVYRLTRKGYTHLVESRVAIPPRSHNKFKVTTHTQHHLSVNDAVIGAELATRDHPHLRLVRMLHQREVKARHVKIEMPNGVKTTVSPDAFLEFALDGRLGGVVLEVDRDTEHDKQWRKKVVELLACGQQKAYRQAFSSDSFVVAAIATEGETHRRQLLRWTELELDKQGKRNWGSMFSFAAGDPAKLDPAELWLGPSWMQPFARTPRTLWEGGV